MADLLPLLIEFPEAERPDALNLAECLSQMYRYVRYFESALSLFEFATEQLAGVGGDSRSPFFGWRFVAARDGAITVYNFRCALDNVTTALHKCPRIVANTSPDVLRALKKSFDQQIPSESLRHAVAHQAEFSAQPEKHSFVGSNVKWLTLSNVLDGRMYTATVNKRKVRYEISSATLALLVSISSQFAAHIKQAILAAQVGMILSTTR